MKLNMRSSAHVFSAVVVPALLLLTAWGNATAMLVFSIIASAAWILVPGIRGQSPFRRGVLSGVVSVAVAVAMSCVMILSRGH